MRERYNEQLAQLNVELITMGALCEDDIHYAAKSLTDATTDSLADISKTTREINQKEREIETMCTRLLLQQQPVARDLRNISSAIRIIYDMERIGIQAAEISEMVEYVIRQPLTKTIHIADMAKATTQMVSDSVDSFVHQDKDHALEVIRYDDVVDNLFLKTKKDLTEILRKNSEEAEVCLDLLMIAKYFERIGDHAVNIAQWVYYAVSGSHFDKEIME